MSITWTDKFKMALIDASQGLLGASGGDRFWDGYERITRSIQDVALESIMRGNGPKANPSLRVGSSTYQVSFDAHDQIINGTIVPIAASADITISTTNAGADTPLLTYLYATAGGTVTVSTTRPSVDTDYGPIGFVIAGGTTDTATIVSLGPVRAATVNVGGITADSDVDWTGDHSFAGSVSFNGTVAHTGAVTYSGAETHSGEETHSGAEIHSGTETHSGVETHSGTVTYDGVITHGGTVTHNGAAIFSGTATFSGDVTHSGEVSHSGSVSFTSSVSFDGSTAFSGSVSFAGSTAFASSVAFTDSVSFAGSVSFTGSVDLGKASLRLYNVREYGAQGDGVTDDFSAIDDAINAAAAAGGGIVYFPAGTYHIGTNDYWTLSSNIVIRGQGPVSLIDVSSATVKQYNGMFRATGALTATTATPSTSISNGDVKIIVDSSSGFAEGDLIMISSDETWSWGTFDTPVGEFAVVRAIPSATAIDVSWKIEDDYTVADNALVTLVNPVRNITIENIKFLGRTFTEGTDGTMGANIIYGENINFRNVSAELLAQTVEFSSVLYGNISGCHIINDPTYNVDAQPYGINYGDACSHVRITGNYVRSGRHGIDQDFISNSPGICRHILIEGNELEGIFANAIATHAGVEDLRIIGNDVVAGPQEAGNNPNGIEVNVGRAVIANNYIQGAHHGIKSTFVPEELTIENNIILDVVDIGIYLDEQEATSPLRNVAIVGNVITGKADAACIWIDFDTNGGEGFAIVGNTLDGGQQGIGLDSDSGVFEGIQISNNVIRGISGGECLLVENARRCHIKGNRTDGGTYGIRLTGASTEYNVVAMNLCTSASTSNITLTGTDNKVFSNLDGSDWSDDATGMPEEGTMNLENLAKNGAFDTWSGGGSAAPDNWTLLGGGSVAQENGSGNVQEGTYSCKLTGDANGNRIYQTIIATISDTQNTRWRGMDVTAGAWIKTTSGNTARLYFEDGVGYQYSDFHTGSGNWEWISVTFTIDASATELELSCSTANDAAPAYFDCIHLNIGTYGSAFRRHRSDP